MIIKIHSTNNKLSNDEMRYCLKYFSHYLLGKRLSNNITIEVFNMGPDKIYWGNCWIIDRDSNKLPRKFGINLYESKQKSKTIETIAHEMVHIKQFCRGDLKFNRPDGAMWKGKVFSNTKVSDKALPWEKECLRFEKPLKKKYLDHLKYEGIKF